MSIVEELLAAGSIQPLIVVGVYNAGDRRLEEYSPTRNRQGIGGGAKRFGRFMVESLKPLVDAEYRTLPGPETTGLGGSSMGGLVSLYLGMRHPAVFGNVIVMSPSLWWANHAILRPARRMQNKWNQRIWLDIGTAEGDTPDSFVRDARVLRSILLQGGWTLGENLRFVEDEGAGHDEKAWGRRIRDALAFLYPPRSATQQIRRDAESELHG